MRTVLPRFTKPGGQWLRSCDRFGAVAQLVERVVRKNFFGVPTYRDSRGHTATRSAAKELPAQ